jgi:predicted naringenin-chalcone synthase
MFITGLGTAAPPRRYAQRDCWEALQGAEEFFRLTERSQAILKKVLTGRSGIVTRHLALENLGQAFELTPDVLHDRFRTHAPMLAADAAQAALRDAVLAPEQVDALIISTCTGYLCPGLTSYVSERLGLRPDILALDLVGQGCAAALPNLQTGQALLASGRCPQVLAICVEVCSAALFFDNDPGVLISACLFGDGAGAAVLATRPNLRRRLEWKTSASVLAPGSRDLLRFEQRAGMLRNILTPQVPAVAAQYAEHVLNNLLRRGVVRRDQISAWALHPGGREVLTALRHSLGLNGRDLRWSEAVLSEFGNVSSASLFFVLQAALAGSAPSGYWWLSSFGAGFSCHGALLEVEP